jgi:hypothetical protein
MHGMQPPESVEVVATAGRVLVRAAPDVPSPAVRSVRAKLRTDARAVAAAAAVSVEQVDGRLRLRVTEPAGRGRTPQVLVEVDVPPGTDVDADVGEADLVCSGPIGTLFARTTSGSVHAEQVLGDLDVATGRGPVTVHHVAGSATVAVADAVLIIRAAAGPLTVRGRSGDVHVWSLRSTTQVSTSTGNVRLGWERDHPVRLEIETSTGRLDLSVEHEPRAANVLSVRTISGDVRITPA